MIKNNKLQKASFIILLITLTLTPLFFIPVNYAPIDISKTIIIIFGILTSCILYIIPVLKERSFSIPKHPLVMVSGLIIISIIISAILSTNIQKSIIGQGFEINTASFLIIMFISSFFISSITFKNKERILYVYSSFLISFLLLFIFHFVRLLDPTFMSFGLLNSSTASLIGKWYDFGIFSGMIFLISFFITRSSIQERYIKILLYVFLFLSGLVIILMNFTIIYYLLALILLAYGIYYFYQNKGSEIAPRTIFSRISKFTLIILIILSIFIWKGNTIISPFLSTFNISPSEISLPWQLTLDVTSDTIKEKPLFGAGPNRFGTEFLLYKPQSLNPSPYWMVDFKTGFSFLSSVFTTNGIVGAILWIIFLVFFFKLGIESLKKIKDSSSGFLIVSTFLSSSFLWIISLLYNPSHVIVFFTFIMTGLFISAVTSENIIETKTYGLTDSRISKKIILVIIIISVCILFLLSFIYIKKIIAISYFQSGISSLNIENNLGIEKAQNSFMSALKWDKNDIYYQALTEVNIIKINSIIQQLQEQNKKDPKTVDKNLVDKLSALIKDSDQLATNAITIDSTNYYNYLSQARVLEIALSVNADGAYEKLKESYSKAIALNPYNPALYLSLAKVEVSKDKADDALKYIGTALNLKSNYIDAVFLLSQIQVNKGDVKGAITSTQFATELNPTNPLLFFQLGFLYYNDKNYQSAVDSLKKAVELNDQYANARYFLGLSYARLEKNTEAIDQFENIAKSNPENEEVSLILTNLKSGKSIFQDAKPPIDTKPEKRSKLPITEKTTSKNIKK